MNEYTNIELLQKKIALQEQEIAFLKSQIERLRKNELKYRLFFEKSRDPFLIIQNFKFIDCNQAALDILKIQKFSDLLETHPSAISPEYQPDGKLSIIKSNEMMNIALTKGYHQFDWMHKAMDGTLFFVKVSLTPIVIDNQLIIFTHWTPLD